MANVNDLDPLDVRDHPGFEARRGRLGHALGAQRIGLSVWVIEPGQAAYPYHFHLGEEEVLVVLEGTPSLRTQAGWRELAQGEAVLFPPGEEGGHQVANWSERPARFLAISTSGDPDIVVYPDSGKLGAGTRIGDRATPFTLFRVDDEVDYHHGEVPPVRPA